MFDSSGLISRYVLAIDVEKYSKRNTRRQADVQGDLVPLVAGALRLSGVDVDADPATWDMQTTGDGLLLVLAADTDGVPLVGRFPRELNTLLEIRNSDRVDAAQIRLRVSIEHNALLPSAAWYAGPALIEVSRLLDAQPVRTALANAAPAHLALIVSERIYETVVQSGLDGLSEKDFAQVDVDISAKDYQRCAYVYVPGKAGGVVAESLGTAPKPVARPGSGDRPHTHVRIKGNDNVTQVAGGDIDNSGKGHRKHP